MQELTAFYTPQQRYTAHLVHLKEITSSDFYEWLMQRVTETPADEDVQNMCLSMWILPCLRMLSDGITEKAIMCLPEWEINLFGQFHGSFFEFQEAIQKHNISEATPDYLKRQAILSDEIINRKKYGDKYAEWERLHQFLPEWIKEDSCVEQFKLVSSFSIEEEFLPLLQTISKEEVELLARCYRGDLFVCLFYIQLLTSVGVKSFAEKQGNISDTWGMTNVKWVSICTSHGTLTFPLYAFREFLAMTCAMVKSEYDLFARFYIEQNEVVIICYNPFNTSPIFHSLKPEDYTYSAGAVNFPIRDWCKNTLLDVTGHINFTDTELESKVYFILKEIERGNTDWVKLLDSNMFNAIFRFYKRGKTLCECLVSVLSVITRVKIEIVSTDSKSLKIAGELYPVYKILDDDNYFINLKKKIISTNSRVYLV